VTAKPLRELGGVVPTWSPEQRWVLASQGVLTELFRGHPARMGGVPRPLASNFAAMFLRRDWGVRTRREALQQIERLHERGHRFDFAQRSEHTAGDLLAWDMVRAAAVAGWSYAAYHLEADEAWPLMVRAARELRGHFDSWAAVGASYLLARNLWREGGADELQPVLDRLLAPGGGWDLPWEVDLDGDLPPPVEVLPELVVDGSGGPADFPTIGAAVEAARVAELATRIVVRAGTYVESVRLSFPVELVADGTVTIENAEGAPLALTRQNAHVRGFHLVSGTSAAGVAIHTVWMKAFFLKLVDCSMRSARCGVYAHTADAFVVLERCRVESAVNTGVLAEDGAHTVLVDSVVRATGSAGVLANGEGELCIEDSRIEDAGNTGLVVTGGVLAEVDGLTIERSGHNGIDLLQRARAVLRSLTVRGTAQTGLLASTSGFVNVIGSSIVGSAANDIGVFAGRVDAKDCTFGGGAGCGLCVAAGAVARLEACTIESTGMPTATIMGNGHGIFVGCDLRGGRDTALWVMPEGNVQVRDCTIDGAAKCGVLLRQARRAHFEGGTITSDVGCLFVVGSGEVVLRGTHLAGGSPAVCAQEGGEVVLADVRIETDGAVALAVEGGSRAALTRTEVEADRGTALTLERGRVDLHRGWLRGEVAATIDAASVLRSWASELQGPVQGNVERVEIDETLHAPGKLTLIGEERMSLELTATALAAALGPHGLEASPQVMAAWIDRALEGQSRGEAIEIGATAVGASVTSGDIASLQLAMARVREVLADPARRASIAAELLEAEAGEDPDGDDDGGEGSAE